MSRMARSGTQTGQFAQSLQILVFLAYMHLKLDLSLNKNEKSLDLREVKGAVRYFYRKSQVGSVY